MWVILHTYELGDTSHEAVGPFATEEEAERFLNDVLGPAPFRTIVHLYSPIEAKQYLESRDD